MKYLRIMIYRRKVYFSSWFQAMVSGLYCFWVCGKAEGPDGGDSWWLTTTRERREPEHGLGGFLFPFLLFPQDPTLWDGSFTCGMDPLSVLCPTCKLSLGTSSQIHQMCGFLLSWMFLKQWSCQSRLTITELHYDEFGQSWPLWILVIMFISINTACLSRSVLQRNLNIYSVKILYILCWIYP